MIPDQAGPATQASCGTGRGGAGRSLDPSTGSGIANDKLRYVSRFSQRISSGVSFTVKAGSVVRSSLSFCGPIRQ